jgi:hypothetical protein
MSHALWLCMQALVDELLHADITDVQLKNVDPPWDVRRRPPGHCRPVCMHCLAAWRHHMPCACMACGACCRSAHGDYISEITLFGGQLMSSAPAAAAVEERGE